MKKIFAVLLAVAVMFTMVACGKKEEAPLADPNHPLWCVHGNHLLADGTANNWNGKDSELYEKSGMKAITLEEVRGISEMVYNALSKKSVKYLYTTEIILGTNDAGWTTEFVYGGDKYRANGSFVFKAASCLVETDGDTKVYSEDPWIPDPKIANVESLTPSTFWVPVWQEAPDEYGFSWASNPCVIGGPGRYTIVVAQYDAVSAAGTPGYGIAAVLKEEMDGLDYELIVPYVPAAHTYGIVGGFAASNWGNAGADIAMTTTDDKTWTGEVELKAGDEFKVRADGDWTYSWGNGADNFKAEEDGTYVVTITFEGENGTVTVTKK